jgi:hypothetical protein
MVLKLQSNSLKRQMGLQPIFKVQLMHSIITITQTGNKFVTIIKTATLSVAIVLLTLCACVSRENQFSQEKTKKLIAIDLKEINRDPYLVNSEYTPAVHRLVDYGRLSLECGVLELLVDEDYMTRVRAWRVLERIILAEMGYTPGMGWKDRSKESEWGDLCEKNGSYKADLPKNLLKTSYLKWSEWVKKNKPVNSSGRLP